MSANLNIVRERVKQSEYIYLVVDEDNVPHYVGKSVDIRDRFNWHKSRGSWAYTVVILEEVSILDRWEDRERFWIAYYRQWYTLQNVRPGGNGAGFHTAETRKKIGDSNRGRKYPPEFGEKSRKRLLGKKLSEKALESLHRVREDPEWRRQQRVSHLGQVPWNKGRAQNEEERAKNPFCSQTSEDNYSRPCLPECTCKRHTLRNSGQFQKGVPASNKGQRCEEGCKCRRHVLSNEHIASINAGRKAAIEKRTPERSAEIGRAISEGRKAVARKRRDAV